MVDVYTVAWNEADVIEWFLAHYSTFADRIFVFDGGSEDGTREIVKSCDRATLLDLDSAGVLRDDLHTEIKNTAWQGKDSDWVICVDADEFLFSPNRDVGSIITELDSSAIALPRVMGVNMFGEVLPRFQGGGQLYDHIILGVRDHGYSKCALFNARRVDRIDYGFGCHVCNPSFDGTQVRPSTASPPLYLLHFKYVGGLDRVLGRFRRSDQRLSDFNRKHGLGVCQEWIVAERYGLVKDYCGPVPGLGGEAIADGPQYTTDWCTNNVPLWRSLLAALVGQPEVHMLEVGTFEGRTAVWLCRNVLTHPTSHLTVVDTFAGGRDQIDFGTDVSNLRSRFNRNVRPYADRIRVIADCASAALRTLEPHGFDAIYLDADHFAASVLEDAVLSWPLLKPGGILIFDDYRWNLYGDMLKAPKLGIDSFLNVFAGQYELLHHGHQIAIKKREPAADRTHC